MMNDFNTKTGRLTGEQSRRLNDLICAEIGKGNGTNAISLMTGVAYSTIADRTCLLRKDGRIPIFVASVPLTAAKTALRRDNKSVGRMGDIFASLGSDAAEWVVANTPKESTAAQFIAAIVRDAYFDATETQETCL